MTEIRQFYIAGAYTSPNPEQVRLNIFSAMDAGLRILRAKEWLPIVPHCSMDHETSWSDAMRVCVATIEKLVPGRDFLVLLPGWEKSRGATIEDGIARSRGIEVVALADIFLR